MADLPYAIIVDGAGAVTEHKLADHEGGTVLSPTPGLTIVSQTYMGGVRTTVLRRALVGVTADHYTFSTNVTTLDFISALGAWRALLPVVLAHFSKCLIECLLVGVSEVCG
jgi:hypothetical protein